MALLSWSDRYQIGDKTIDSEHRELFRLVNDFHTHWLEQRERKDIAEVLNQLVKYAQLHFGHEESIMIAAEYPGLTEHQKAHEDLFDAIFNLHNEYQTQDLHLEMDTIKFLRNWLVDHVINNDYMFRDYLAKRKSVVPTDKLCADPGAPSSGV